VDEDSDREGRRKKLVYKRFKENTKGSFTVFEPVLKFVVVGLFLIAGIRARYTKYEHTARSWEICLRVSEDLQRSKSPSWFTDKRSVRDYCVQIIPKHNKIMHKI